MSMSKKDFIAIADAFRQVRSQMNDSVLGMTATDVFSISINLMAEVCQSQNPRFMRDRWLSYIAGECGPNGGGVKEPRSWAVQGNYGQGWETVCTEDNRKEALIRLREYRENETQYSHRIVRE